MNIRENRFSLTEAHIKLLQSAYVEFDDSCEAGGFASNMKRPYGNSDYLHDIALIIGLMTDRNQEMTDEQEELCERYHRETATALRVILATKSFEPGVYAKEKNYGNDWKRVSSENMCVDRPLNDPIHRWGYNGQAEHDGKSGSVFVSFECFGCKATKTVPVDPKSA